MARHGAAGSPRARPGALVAGQDGEEPAVGRVHVDPGAVPAAQPDSLVDGVDRAQSRRARGEHHGPDLAAAQQLIQGAEVHPAGPVHRDRVGRDAQQAAHPAVRVVRVRAERDAPARMELAGHEQGLQVGDGAAAGEVAQVGAEAEHARELRGHLAFHPRGGRAAVQRVVVRVDQHRGQVAGHGGRVRGLEHLPRVARVEERVVVRQALGELGERCPEGLVADLQRRMRGKRPEPCRPGPVRRGRLTCPPLEIHLVTLGSGPPRSAGRSR